ncbi:MAG: T9SS type A sorting domain-containing protein [Bacteroidota bacterium]|nr:MAG: T9SS type A sorting domain-containing protein [Bacteroidota bacterium]
MTELHKHLFCAINQFPELQGLCQLAQQNEINISPNPSSGQFLISDFSLTQAGNIEIYNAVGQKVNFNITSVGNNTLKLNF